jgi:ketosteroid isomerase-like protein
MTNKQIILAFIDRINARDVEALGALMSDDHTFIDAHGNQISGKETMKAGWRGYFEWFPDYQIEITDMDEDGDAFALRHDDRAESSCGHELANLRRLFAQPLGMFRRTIKN